MQNCAVSINLMNLSPTTYWDYEFNSFAVAFGKFLGGSPNGLFELDAGDTDAGSEILAKFRPVLTDFGEERTKRVRAVVLGMEAEGNLLLTLYGDEQYIGEYTVDTDMLFSAQHGVKKIVSALPLARYWSVEIENVDGVDFSIDRIMMELILRVQRFALRHIHAKGAVAFPEFSAGNDYMGFPEFVIASTGTAA